MQFDVRICLYLHIGPTYKVKRSVVTILHAAAIDELYEKEVSSRLSSEFYQDSK